MDASLYRPYSPQFFHGQDHPGLLIESAILASIKAPDLGVFDKSKIDLIAGLSASQKDAVYLACQQFSNKTSRHGFLLGDGPGVGKSRIIAGVIKVLFANHKNAKAVWVTVSDDLQGQVKKELEKVGLNDIRVVQIQELDHFQQGRLLLMCTYSTLSYKRTSDNVTNLQKVVRFCGSDFNGLIALDECQRAKNLKFSENESTATGKAIKDLQFMLPNANVLYSSATSISRPEHFLYLDRLDLWGKGCQFGSFKEFEKKLTSRGFVAMEVLIQHLKLSGKFIARKLSYDGVKCTLEKVSLSSEMKKAYNVATCLWRDALELIYRGKTAPSSIVMARFWSAQQRFFRNFCLSLKVERAVAIAREAIRNKHCVVFGIQSTGESASKQSKLYSLSENEVCKYILTSVVHEVVLPNLDSPEIADDLLRKIKASEMPTNFLDDLVEKLGGTSIVAEMTGRFNNNKKTSLAGSRNNKVREEFQHGAYDVAIISDVTSTGFDLHNDIRRVPARKRIHITLELPWSAEKTIQQLGRTNRANQYDAPHYIFLTTELCGEVRFAAAVVHKLQQLGALTHGCRSFLCQNELVNFEFDYQNATSGVQRMCCSLESTNSTINSETREKARELLSFVSFDTINPPTNKLFEKFMNRLLGLAVENQDFIFNLFLQHVDKREEHIVKIYTEVVLLDEKPFGSFENLYHYIVLVNTSVDHDNAQKNLPPTFAPKIDSYGRPLYVEITNDLDCVKLVRPIDGSLKVDLRPEEYAKMGCRDWDDSLDAFRDAWAEALRRCCNHTQEEHGNENLRSFEGWYQRNCKYTKKQLLGGNLWDYWETVTALKGEDSNPNVSIYKIENNRILLGVAVEKFRLVMID